MVNSDGGVVHTIGFVREPMVDWVVHAATQMVGRCGQVRCVSDGTLTIWNRQGRGRIRSSCPGSVMTGCGAGTRTSWLSRDAASKDRGTFGRGTETMGL